MCCLEEPPQTNTLTAVKSAESWAVDCAALSNLTTNFSWSVSQLRMSVSDALHKRTTAFKKDFKRERKGRYKTVSTPY
jgi:hypothetical protein